MNPGTDYEEQMRSNNRIRDTVINATRRIICYNLPIYDDMQLEVTEYAGLTLAVRDSSVLTEVQPVYNQTAIQIIDDDSKLHFVHKKECSLILFCSSTYRDGLYVSYKLYIGLIFF